MKLHEQEDDIQNVLGEEPEHTGDAGSSAPVNNNDFVIESLDIPAEKKTEPAAAPAAEAKKETVTEKTTTNADGTKTVEVVVKKEGAAEGEGSKGTAFARAFNPNTVILFSDILLTRIGGIFTPERPREYWALSADDKKDLAVLMSQSASEGNWQGFPAKYLLMIVILIILGGKIVYAKKTQHAFVPGERPGNNAGGSASTGSAGSSSSTPDTDKEYKRLFMMEKARHEVEMNYSSVKEEITEIRKQNEYLKQLVDKAQKDQTPGRGIQDVKFEEIRSPKTKMDESGDYIFKDSTGREWNLDQISFKASGALVDPRMAGQPGYTHEGVKRGNVNGIGQQEAILEWRRYKKKLVNA